MKFYRYDDIPYENGYVKVVEKEFELDKETPCGYWVKDPSFFGSDLDDRRWISKTARKRFAYPTKELAIASFVARKKQQIRFSRIRLERAELAFRRGLEMMKDINGVDE